MIIVSQYPQSHILQWIKTANRFQFIAKVYRHEVNEILCFIASLRGALGSSIGKNLCPFCAPVLTETNHPENDRHDQRPGDAGHYSISNSFSYPLSPFLFSNASMNVVSLYPAQR